MVRERAGLALVFASVLDLVGARGGGSLERTVEYVGWRSVEARLRMAQTPNQST